MNHGRLVALIVAVALFMENMDSTVIATSLPAIAADMGTNPLALKLAVTSYLLSLAVFIPVSGWTADRFGARTVFRAAIAVFMCGSILCAMSDSLGAFVVARIIQGMGGAMMTPVGRLILVRTVERRYLVDAMAWLTMPALIGPILGPPVGGFITTYVSWHWIFLINIPIGIVGLILITLFIDDIRAEEREPFDLTGMVLCGVGIAGVAFGLSVAGLDFLPNSIVAALIIGGAVFLVLYYFHAKRVAVPALDLTLFRLPTFRASVTGGFLFRLGVGAWPFLVPLLLQVGLGLTPFQSGTITFAGAMGAMVMKPVIRRFLHTFGFRRVLVGNAVLSGAFLAACALFNELMPFWMMFLILLVGGFFRSLEFTAINTLAYAEIPSERAGKATAMVAVMQQVAISSGVALGALAVDFTLHWRGAGELSAADFPPAFIFIGVVSACACFVFRTLDKNAGSEMANRVPAASDSSDQRGG